MDSTPHWGYLRHSLSKQQQIIGRRSLWVRLSDGRRKRSQDQVNSRYQWDNTLAGETDGKKQIAIRQVINGMTCFSKHMQWILTIFCASPPAKKRILCVYYNVITFMYKLCNELNSSLSIPDDRLPSKIAPSYPETPGMKLCINYTDLHHIGVPKFSNQRIWWKSWDYNLHITSPYFKTPSLLSPSHSISTG